MPFMQPDIQQADYFNVETNDGTETVPADLVRMPFTVDFRAGGVFTDDMPEFPALQRALAPYLSGGNISEVRPGSGWIARMSAPGYMDCTDWSAHATEEEARECLEEMFGDMFGEEE
jgi:hypothetical protein